MCGACVRTPRQAPFRIHIHMHIHIHIHIHSNIHIPIHIHRHSNIHIQIHIPPAKLRAAAVLQHGRVASTTGAGDECETRV
jgi:hypothetical protein